MRSSANLRSKGRTTYLREYNERGQIESEARVNQGTEDDGLGVPPGQLWRDKTKRQVVLECRRRKSPDDRLIKGALFGRGTRGAADPSPNCIRVLPPRGRDTTSKGTIANL